MPVPLQLDFFGAPGVPYERALPPAPEAPPSLEPSPALMPEAQLSFVGGRVLRVAPVAALLADGRFDDALAAAAKLAGEERLACELQPLVRAVGAAPSLDALADLDLGDALERLSWPGNAAIVAASRTGRLVAVARALDGVGPGAKARGRLAAHYWSRAQLSTKAVQSLERTLAARPESGEALVALGNLAHAEGDAPRARELYRRALRAAPDEVRLEDVADGDVRDLAAGTGDLGLAPVNAWLPFVGLLLAVFGPSPEAFDRAPTDADRFASALQRSRLATSRGRPDVPARRELKALAGELYARLFEAGLV